LRFLAGPTAGFLSSGIRTPQPTIGFFATDSGSNLREPAFNH
jgi:hypothetical protein